MRKCSNDDKPNPNDQVFHAVEKILGYVGGVSAETAESILVRCLSRIRSRQQIDKLAEQCGLRLANFRTGVELELYYDMHQKNRASGYISKRWTEPGFRIGDVILLPPKAIKTLQDNLMGVVTHCTACGIVITGSQAEDGYRLAFDQVVSSEGLNKKTLKRILSAIEECSVKIRRMACPS